MVRIQKIYDYVFKIFNGVREHAYNFELPHVKISYHLR